MVVSIDFFGPQRSLTQTNNIAMPINEETRVTDALIYVKNQYPELPLDERMVLVTVNEEMASLDRLLQADDTVSFLHYICGG